MSTGPSTVPASSPAARTLPQAVELEASTPVIPLQEPQPSVEAKPSSWPTRVVDQNGKPLHLEVRTLRDKDRELPFDFLVIDKPEKWLPATDFFSSYTMDRPNSNQSMKFNCRPFSLEEWENAEYSIPFPDPDLASNVDATSEDSQKYQQEKRIALEKRKAYFLETGVGLKIPGSTLEEKAAWLGKRGQGEIDALYDYLTDELSGFKDGALLDMHNSISLSAERKTVTEITDFSDWLDASQVKLVFRAQRSTQPYVSEFPLRNLSAEDKRKLDDENKQPTPPKIPSRGKDGHFDPSKLVDDWNDYGFRQRMRAYSRKRLVMMIEAVLIFEIPGMTAEEKYTWLGQRVVGDVVKIRNFIEDQVIGYRRHYESFI